MYGSCHTYERIVSYICILQTTHVSSHIQTTQDEFVFQERRIRLVLSECETISSFLLYEDRRIRLSESFFRQHKTNTYAYFRQHMCLCIYTSDNTCVCDCAFRQHKTNASFLSRVRESCHTYVCVCVSFMSHMQESSHTYERVRQYI